MIEVTLQLEEFDAMFSALAMERAQAKMAHDWRDLMEPYVPMRYGPLRENVDVGRQEITYTEGYANRVYNMDADSTHWSTNGTGPSWNEAAKSERLGDLEEMVGETILDAR